MGLATGHMLVQHDAIKAFARRIRQQFLRQRKVLLAGEAKTINHRPQFIFRRLDTFGNLHLLFARQQRHQPHLLEIHPHRIVQRVEVAGFNLVLFRFFGRIHLRMIHDFNFQLAELR